MKSAKRRWTKLHSGLGLAPLLEMLEDRSVPVITAAFAGTLSLNSGVDVRASALPENEMEVHIAANPATPGQLSVTSNNENGPNQLLLSSTTAGNAWSQTLYSGDVFTAGTRFDGATAIDDFGNVHIAYMWSNGGTNAAIIHAVSFDGGASFTATTLATGPNLDKPWLAVGPDAQNLANQVVIVTYENAIAPNQFIFARGASITGLGAIGTFTPAVQVSDPGVSNFATPAIGPNGEVAITWSTFTGSGLDAWVTVDHDSNGLVGGLAFGTDVIASTTNISFAEVIPAAPERTMRPAPYLTYDRSGGAHNGRLYVIYVTEPVEDSNDYVIRSRYSDDDGATFSGPWLVSGTTIRSRFLQTASVDQDTGYLWVSYYDCRNDYTGSPTPGLSDNIYNNETQYFVTVSVDGGMAFLPDIAVSDGVSSEDRADPSWPGPGADFNDYGDYTGIAAIGGSAYVTWGDNSNGVSNDFDVAVDRVWLSSSGGQNIFATGTAGADTYDVRLDSTGVFLQIYENNPSMTGVPTFTATYAAVNKLFFNTGAGDDTLRFDFSNGNPIPVNGYAFDGEADLDKILMLADRSYMLSDALLAVSGAADGTLASVERADLTGGSGANVFTVNNWHGASTLAGAAGVDTYHLTMVDSMGPIDVVETGTPDAAVTVFGTSAADTFTVVGSTVTRGSEAVNFSGVADLTIDGSNGADTFNVTPSATTTINIIGNTPNDSFADYLVLDHSGATAPTLNATGNRVGNWTYGNRMPVNYSTIEKMTPGASISGRAYLDADRNRVDTGGVEPGLGGKTITLYGDAGTLFAMTTTTAAGTGDYTFTDLVPGYHRVRQNASASHMQSSENPAAFDHTAPVSVTNVKFGSIAVSIYWTGAGGSSLWNNAANWSTNSLPGPTDDVGIPAGVAATSPGNSGITAIKSLVSYSSIGADGFYNIALTDDSLIDGDLTIGGDFNGAGKLTVTGTIHWIGGTMAGSGETEVFGGVEFMTGTYGYAIYQSLLRLHGLTKYTAGFMTISNGGQIVIASDGIFEVDKPNTSYSIDLGSGSGNQITNYGILRNKNPNSGLSIRVPFYNYGDVFAIAGSVFLDGGGINASSFSGNPGSTIRIGGGAQAMHFVAGAAGYGDFVLDISGGTLTVDVPTTVRGVNLGYGGYLNGAANLTATLTFRMNGGTANGSGTIYANGGMDVAQTSSIAGSIVHVGGSGSWTFGSLYIDNGSQLIIDEGGLLNFQGTSNHGISRNTNVGSALVVNNGTFRSSLTSQMVTCYVPFNNTGTVDAVSGVIQLNGGGINTGVFGGAASGKIGIGSGTMTFQLGASMTTALGLFHINGGMLILDADVNIVAGPVTMEGYGIVLAGAGNLTANGKLNMYGGTITGTGQTIAAGGAEFGVYHSTLDGRSLHLQGSSLWLGAYIYINDGAQLIVDAGATFAMNNYGNWQGWAINGGLTSGVPNLVNFGTILVSNTNGDGNARIGVPIANHGLVNVQSGVMHLLAGGLNLGTFDGTASGTIQFYYEATPVVFQTALPQGNGGVKLYVYTGMIRADSNATFKNLELHAGKLGGAADISVTGTLDWSAYGAMVDAGKTIIDGTLNVLPGYVHSLQGRNLVVNGLVNHQAEAIRFDYGAKITVNPSGVYQFAPPGGQSAPSIVRYYGGATPELIVNGILRKTGGGYGAVGAGITTTINGTVQVEDGSDLYFNDGLPLGGGTLRGVGKIFANTTTTSTSTIAPGMSAGILTINGNLIYNAASSLGIELNGTAVGTQYDQLVVNGAVNLAGANLNVTRGFSPSIGTQFTILDNDGGDPIVGTFNGLAQGATFQVGGQSFTISYTGGTGNDIVLEAASAGDSVAPTVVGMYFGGTLDSDGAGTADTVWTSSFRTAAGNATYGFPAQTASNQLKSMPWSNIDTVYVQFSENVNVASINLGVRGLNLANYAIASFTYDNVNFVAKWVLTGAGPGGNIETDRMIFDLDGDSGTAVADLAGNKLAGGWTEGVSTFPTTGAAGQDFKYRFVVAVGDADRNGLVRNADVNLVRSNLFVDAGQAGYNIFADIDGNGLVRNADTNVTRSHLFVDPPAGPGPNRPGRGDNDRNRRIIANAPGSRFTAPDNVNQTRPRASVRRLSTPVGAEIIDSLFAQF